MATKQEHTRVYGSSSTKSRTVYFIIGLQILMMVGYFSIDYLAAVQDDVLKNEHQRSSENSKTSQTFGKSHWCVNFNDSVVRDIQNGLLVPSKENRTLYLIPMGRTGNILFQIAGVYAMAHDTRANIVVEKRSIFEGFKNSPFKVVEKGYLQQQNLTRYHSAHGTKVFVEAFKVLLNDSIIYRHFMQKFAYFQGCWEEVRDKIHFRDEIVEKAQMVLRAILHKSNSTREEVTFVGIQIRRGDITHQNFQNYGYRTPNASYFARAMDYYENRYQKCIFVVTTTDTTWAALNLNRTNVYISKTVAKMSALEDMALVANCNHSITSFGTYSWWCGFLNKGKTVYYKDCIRNNSNFYKRISYKAEEYFPQQWIPMS